MAPASIAFYATLSNQSGIALRLPGGSVHFRTESTHQWQTLCNDDGPRLQLLGRCDLADAQASTDQLHGGAAAICTSRQNLEV